MMTSTRETRRRAHEKEEGDDNNDNKVTGFLATKNQWPLQITKNFILVHKNSALTCAPVHATRRSSIFSKK